MTSAGPWNPLWAANDARSAAYHAYLSGDKDEGDRLMARAVELFQAAGKHAREIADAKHDARIWTSLPACSRCMFLRADCGGHALAKVVGL